MKYIFTYIFLIFSTLKNFSQNPDKIIIEFWKNNYKMENLEPTDISDLKISSSTLLSNKNTTIYYVNQQYNGIMLENAIATMAVKNNKVISNSHSFQSNIKNKIEFNSAKVFVKEVMDKVLILKNYPTTTKYKTEINRENSYTLATNNLPNQPIYLDLVYTKTKSNKLQLVWNVELYDYKSKKLYLVKLDANNGNIIKDESLTINCNNTSHQHHLQYSFKQNSFYKKPNAFSANSQYLVYDFNLTGPIQGERSIQINPYNLIASPYGWHNNNQSPASAFTITKGNNVFAYEDRENANSPGYAPNGTSSLNFNFPYSGPNTPPISYLDASITNLFYITNKMHDVLYSFGFDENSGNFQDNQLNRMSSSDLNGPDALLAESQDGSGLNNANISVPRDGSSPRMQMYLWKKNENEIIRILNPSAISGNYLGLNNSFTLGNVDLPIRPNVISGNVVLVNSPNNEACSSIINSSELNGNIALIKRGDCSFTDKAIRAQNAGAIAVIIMGNTDNQEWVNMSGENSNIVIPVIYVLKQTGDTIIQELNNQNIVTLEIAKNDSNLVYDSSFDNSIIIHEYTHGVSVRLTGGRTNATCLTSAEQMGEGWSDYFSLFFQMKNNDNGESPIGVGSFVSGGNTNESGIRKYPYSTNMSINPLTYGITNDFYYTKNDTLYVNSHQVGTVWTSMLWDVTWKLVDTYGFDSNLNNIESGNYKAMQLVINALKLQPCNPSFITGRNAILKADEILYNSQNSCLIWEAFSRRGLGIHASSGLNDFPEDIRDQIEDFTMPDTCSNMQNYYTNNPFISIYPNPTNDILFIKIPKYTEKLYVEIFDIHGRLVKSDNLDNYSEIGRLSTALLVNGIYFIKLNGINISHTSKFVKK